MGASTDTTNRINDPSFLNLCRNPSSVHHKVQTARLIRARPSRPPPEPRTARARSPIGEPKRPVIHARLRSPYGYEAVTPHRRGRKVLLALIAANRVQTLDPCGRLPASSLTGEDFGPALAWRNSRANPDVFG
jgi:hypothetical protein